MNEHLIRLIDWMRWGASQFNAHGLFFGHGTDNAWDEAVYLVLNALHLPPNMPSASFESRLTSKERANVANLLNQRIQTRKPAAYLTNEAWFADLPFYVDERVIIPRSPFAEILRNHVCDWLDRELSPRILDLGTGSCCMAILCAMLFPKAQIDAADVAPKALEVASINIERHQLRNQINLIQSDGFSRLTGPYDLIITNPPYVSYDQWQDLPMEYHYEPKTALVSGVDGMSIARHILHHASRFLTDNGILVMEVGTGAGYLQRLYPQTSFIWLDLQYGGEGVCLLTKTQLDELSHYGR
jgi:ribosomal protein L3 glutamine methyltransferase